MIKLAPSILSADFSNMGEQLKRIEKAGAEYVHIDVMDGHFVPNISVGVPLVKSISKTSDLVFDVHLMISDPGKYADVFIDSGADIVNWHLETETNHKELIKSIKSRGKKAGLTIKPMTEATAVFEYLPLLDLVLIMTVEPGFGGQKMIGSCLKKIREIRDFADSKNLCMDVEADGGIDLDNVADVMKSGANVIVAGSAVFNEKGIENNVFAFKEIFKNK